MLARERLNNVLDACAMEEVEVRNRPRFVEHSTGCSATLAHDELAFQKIQLRGILAFCKGKNPMNPPSVFQVIGTH